MFAVSGLTLRQRISDWIFRARAPENAPVVLTQRRIFILPSRTGYFFALVLLLLLIASINYSLSLGYMLTFLLAGMGGVSMLHTFTTSRNCPFRRAKWTRFFPVMSPNCIWFFIIRACRGLRLD